MKEIEKLKNTIFFFEENNKWYIYKTADNSKLEIMDITNIIGNPIVVFIKEIKNFMMIFIMKQLIY